MRSQPPDTARRSPGVRLQARWRAITLMLTLCRRLVAAKRPAVAATPIELPSPPMRARLRNVTALPDAASARSLT